MRRPDLNPLAIGLAIVVLGVLLLLHADGSIDLEGGWLAAAITACGGAALLASGLGARDS
jgi:hypothetical protein